MLDPQFYKSVAYKGEVITSLGRKLELEPLDIAASKKNIKLIKALDYSIIDSGEVMFYAIECRNLRLLQRPLKERSFIYVSSSHPLHHNIPYPSNLSALGAAIAKDWLMGVKCLLAAEFSLELEKCEEGGALAHPLNVAMQFGRLKIAKYLLDCKANPNGFKHRTAPIFDAIKKNKLELVKLLVEHKASLVIKNKRDKVHCYPFVSALLNNNHEIIHYLLENMGYETAIKQLANVSIFFKSRAHRERALLEHASREITSLSEKVTTSKSP